VVRGVAFCETSNLTQLTGYDAANDRGVYRYIGPDALGPLLDFQNGEINDATGEPFRQAETIDLIKRNVLGVADLSSRWRIQIGLRYDFSPTAPNTGATTGSPSGDPVRVLTLLPLTVLLPYRPQVGARFSR
jgi:hypothetical protein